MKTCISCNTNTTVQWYTGPNCKPCYRRQHRKQNRTRLIKMDRIRYKTGKSAILTDRKEFYRQNSDKIKLRTKNYRSVHGNKHRPDYHSEWRSKNPEKAKEASRRWVANRRDTVKQFWAFHTAKRRAAKLRATPSWMTQQDLDKIREIYQSCPIGFHVDHIVPLQGNAVSGLHVPWNLQVLPAELNLKKSNKLL